MNIGSFSAHVPGLAYYVFIGTTNSAQKNFFRTIRGLLFAKNIFFPRKSYSIRSDEIRVIRLRVCPAHTKISENLRCVS